MVFANLEHIDATTWRGVERLAIVLSATVISYLGYRLYVLGITQGESKFHITRSRVGQVLVSGIGPGLLFMCFGATVLVVGLLKGGAEVHTPEGVQSNMLALQYFKALEARASIPPVTVPPVHVCICGHPVACGCVQRPQQPPQVVPKSAPESKGGQETAPKQPDGSKSGSI